MAVELEELALEGVEESLLVLEGVVAGMVCYPRQP